MSSRTSVHPLAHPICSVHTRIVLSPQFGLQFCILQLEHVRSAASHRQSQSSAIKARELGNWLKFFVSVLPGARLQNHTKCNTVTNCAICGPRTDSTTSCCPRKRPKHLLSFSTAGCFNQKDLKLQEREGMGHVGCRVKSPGSLVRTDTSCSKTWTLASYPNREVFL